jgi:hypothetical protein
MIMINSIAVAINSIKRELAIGTIGIKVTVLKPLNV